MTRFFTAALLASAALPAAAGAQSYSVRDDFGASVFRYGYGTGGGAFTAFTRQGVACGLNNTQTCYDNGGDVPYIARNNQSSSYMNSPSSTVTIPAGAVHMHPGSSGATDAILRFVVPVAGAYDLAGDWRRYDTTQNGDGVSVSVFQVVGGVSTLLFNNGTSTYDRPSAFSLTTAALGAGDFVDFVLNRRSDYTYDATGLSATISLVGAEAGVPEPATWGLMLAGFGLAGAALRARRRSFAFG